MADPGQTGSNLPELFEAWGFSMDGEHVVGDANAALRVQVAAGGRQQVVDYLAWLGLEGSMIAADPATADIRNINMATAGALTPAEGATTEFTPLLTSSEQSTLIESIEVAFMTDPARLWETFEPSGTRYALAARVTGPAKTAFPDGPPKTGEEGADQTAEGDGESGGEPSAETAAGEGDAQPDDDAASDGAGPGGTAAAEGDDGAEAAAAHRSEGDVTVLVVGDTDILRDQFWVQRQNFFGRDMVVENAGNGDFVLNAIDGFAGNPALIGLRSRGTTQRPFTLVRELERAAEAEYRSREQALRAKLDETQKNLNELQTEVGGEGEVILTDEQQAALDSFTAEVLQTRQQLRDVQQALREDIERLEGWLKFANIALIPLAIAVGAIGLALWQRRRRRQARSVQG